MSSYGQFCPVARGSEIFAERWTPIILRNVLQGCHTFNEIAAGAPGLSRALLTRRLRELARHGVITIRPKPVGRGSVYEPTPAGRELWPVLRALGDWAEEWIDVTAEHADPGVVLWSWSGGFLRRDLLPDRRIVVRFEAEHRGRLVRGWLLIERREAEICLFDPGFGDDLVVTISDPVAFARWHLGLVEWSAAVRSGAIRVTGPRKLQRALPTWNAGPQIHAQLRAEHRRSPVSRPLSPVQPASPPSAARRTAQGAVTGPSVPGFAGQLVTTDDPEYDAARAVWNAAVDRRPRYIARCMAAADVTAALRFGRQKGVPIVVRGRGHDITDGAVCDDGLVIDLGGMRSLTVEPGSLSTTVGAGVAWGELDAATQAFGLATTGGIVSPAGVSGHTLGGGWGWLMRRHGLTVDNLLAAEVVTADGRLRVVDERSEPELFWGLRGGGRGLGIVTAWRYRLHSVGPEVLAGPVLWAMKDAPEVLREYRDLLDGVPREVSSAMILRRAPQSPFLPVELHRRPVCMIALLALGEPAVAERLLAPLRDIGRPLIDLVRHRPYTDLQSMYDATAPPGWHYDQASAGLPALTDPVIDTLLEHAGRAPSPDSCLVVMQGGGAVAAVASDATAYARRGVAHEVRVLAAWPPGVGEAESAWARAAAAAVEPRPAAPGGSRQRLAALRRRFDPDGVFRPDPSLESS